MKDLPQLRVEIDRVDREIVAALQERCALSREIGLYKKERALPVLDAAREELLLQKIAQLNSGVIPEAQILDIYRAILAASRKIQEDL